MEKMKKHNYMAPSVEIVELSEPTFILVGSPGSSAPGAGGGAGSTGGGQANSTEGFPRFQSVFGDTSEDVEF